MFSDFFFRREGRVKRSICLLLTIATMGGVTAFGAPKHHATPTPTTQDTPVASANPMLPAPIVLQTLWPELTLVQKLPAIAPQGFDPVYAAADWQAYRDRFGAAADALPRDRASGIATFAEALIAAATTPGNTLGDGAAAASATPETQPTTPIAAHHPHEKIPAPETAIATNVTVQLTPGLRRLLLLRAATITFRSHEGNATAQKALAALVPWCDRHEPMHMAMLYTIADAMSRQSTTPKETRSVDAALAVRANVTLCQLLINLDQIAATDAVVKLLGREEGVIRSNPTLHVDAALARTLVKQTVVMMDDLGKRYTALGNGDESAAIPLYCYARFVKQAPEVARAFADHRRNTPVAQLDALLNKAYADPTAAYTVAESLQQMADPMPDGVLKHRTMYAVLTLYRSYLNCPATEVERVKRTLAKMATQQVLAAGAAPPPQIDAFAPDKPVAPAATAGPTATAQAPVGSSPIAPRG
jgi:hypothetical protein